MPNITNHRGRHIEIPVIYNLTPNRMAAVKKNQKITSADGAVGKLGAWALSAGT